MLRRGIWKWRRGFRRRFMVRIVIFMGSKFPSFSDDTTIGADEELIGRHTFLAKLPIQKTTSKELDTIFNALMTYNTPENPLTRALPQPSTIKLSSACVARTPRPIGSSKKGTTSKHSSTFVTLFESHSSMNPAAETRASRRELSGRFPRSGRGRGGRRMRRRTRLLH